jgi:hypothetical protein
MRIKNEERRITAMNIIRQNTGTTGAGGSMLNGTAGAAAAAAAAEKNEATVSAAGTVSGA